MTACPLCRERKGKRLCPAKQAGICSACCGSKRLVEIACPADCVYLAGGHAGGWDGRETERNRDMRRVAAHVQSLSETQAQLFLLGVLGLATLRAERRELTDRVVLEGVAALRKTVETRSHGILFEHEPGDPRAHGVLHALRQALEPPDEQGRPVSPPDSELLPALTALEAAVRGTLQEGYGATAFLDTAGRVAADLRGQAQPDPPSRLIVP